MVTQPSASPTQASDVKTGGETSDEKALSNMFAALEVEQEVNEWLPAQLQPSPLPLPQVVYELN